MKEILVSSHPEQTETRLAKMASEIELLNGGQFPLSMDFEDLCLYLGGDLTGNFQMTNMEKYDNIGCPKMHLRMYYNAMF